MRVYITCQVNKNGVNKLGLKQSDCQEPNISHCNIPEFTWVPTQRKKDIRQTELDVLSFNAAQTYCLPRCEAVCCLNHQTRLHGAMTNKTVFLEVNAMTA
jgi:hypothetical protein